MQIQATARPQYLEIIAITDSVTAPKLIRVMDVLANELERNSPRDVLIEVRAQSRDIPLFEIFEILAHAIKRPISHTKIAYVVTGRPLPGITRFYADIAAKRGLKIKFFSDRREALNWLGVDEKSIAA